MFDTSVPIPKTLSAESFCSFMSRVWEDKCEPGPDGGVIIHGNPLYPEWHNARKAITLLGGVFLYPSRKHGIQFRTYQLPDGSKVLIHPDGSEVKTVNLRDRSLAA